MFTIIMVFILPSCVMSGHGYRDVQLHDARLYRGGTARGAQTVKFWVKMFDSSL